MSIEFEKMTEPFIDKDYSSRKGYDKDFLGIRLNIDILYSEAINIFFINSLRVMLNTLVIGFAIEHKADNNHSRN